MFLFDKIENRSFIKFLNRMIVNFIGHLLKLNEFLTNIIPGYIKVRYLVSEDEEDQKSPAYLADINANMKGAAFSTKK